MVALRGSFVRKSVAAPGYARPPQDPKGRRKRHTERTECVGGQQVTRTKKQERVMYLYV